MTTIPNDKLKGVEINEDLKEAVEQVLEYDREGCNRNEKYDNYVDVIDNYRKELNRVDDSIKSGLVKNIVKVQEELNFYRKYIEKFDYEWDAIQEND